MENKFSKLSFKDDYVFNKSFNISKSARTIFCKNLYLIYRDRFENKLPAINYSLRTFYYFKLINFFKLNGFNIIILLRIFRREFQNMWRLFLHEFDVEIYINILVKLTIKYEVTFVSNFFKLNCTNNIIRPSSYLMHTNFFMNDDLVWCDRWNKFKGHIKKNNSLKLIDIFQKLRQPKFWALQFNDSFSPQFKQSYLIHFLRVQRRYNKRRYSRVRAISRPPFFAGISLSSILVACFWNSSIKSVDWFTSLIVVIDINLVLAILIIYFLSRLFRVYNISTFIRSRGKARVSYSLNFLFIKNYLNRFIK